LTIERFFASLRFEQRGMLDQLGGVVPQNKMLLKGYRCFK
jgi:hypothetical protein